MLPPGCTRSAGLLAPGSTWTSCCDAAAPGDGLPMHTIAMALAQMTECMRAMRGKIDRTDRAVRDVAHRLSSQKRIIERVDRRIVALETRPAQSARHSHHVPRSHSLGSFNCALCGRAGACRAPAARSAPDVRQPAYAPAHAPRQTLSCCYGEDAGGSFFSAPSTVYTCAVGRPQRKRQKRRARK